MGAQTYLPVEILDYIETHAPPEEAPYGVSQRELAKALGYHPCSMSRPLATLTTDGLLDSRRGLVRDGQRRQLTYRITETGRARLRKETKQVPLLSGEIPPPPHPFLGRRDELDQLATFSREGGSVTFIDGPPGMGKTALVSRHLRRIKRGRVPFWFIIRPASSPRQFVYALSHALSFLGAPQLAYYTQLPRAPVAREVADLTARALDGRSLAAVVDDVQQAGPDMRAFLSEFVRAVLRGAEHEIFFISQEGPLFQTDSVPSHRLTVGGLDRAAAHELTDRQGGLADRFESVYQTSLGSPLLLKLAVLNPGVETDATNLPSVVVGRLVPDELEGILPIALANEPLPISFLTEFPHMTAGRLTELSRTGLLHRTLQGRVEMLQVVRDALLRRAHPPDERRAHLRLANFYGRSHRPEALRERFLHLVAAEDWKSAAQILTQQERVILRLGYSETLRSSLRHLASVLPRSHGKVRVLMIEATLLRAHSDYGDALQSLRRAIAEAAGEPRTTAECHLLSVEILLRLQQVETAQKEFEIASGIGPVSRRLSAFFQLSQGRLEESTGGHTRAQAHYQEAFELARKTRNIDLELESIAAWSRVVELQSGHDVALKLIAEALPEARRAGRMDIVLNLLLARARAYAKTGREELAEVEMKTVRTEAESLGYLNQLTYTLSGLASMAIEGKRWAEGIAYAKQASAMAERLGNDLVLGHTLALLCSMACRQANWNGELSLIPEAVANGERSVEVLSRIPTSDSLALAHSYLAEAYALHRDRKRAIDHYQAALQTAEKLELMPLADEIRKEVGSFIQSQASATAEASTPTAEVGSTTQPSSGGR